MRAMEALKTFVELRLLSQIQEQDTLEGNGACQYDDYERGKIDAYPDYSPRLKARGSIT